MSESSVEGANVVLGVTGSIAAYKACEIVSRLRRQECGVDVIMTEAARQFVAPLSFETLAKSRVVTDLWTPPATYDPLHISLAEKADAIVVAPATANTIGKLANGIADNALTCTVTAARCPIVIAPAMNDLMYANPVVQANVAKLTELGYTFVGPVEGRLASGKVGGQGRMAEPEAIVDEVSAILQRQGLTDRA